MTKVGAILLIIGFSLASPAPRPAAAQDQADPSAGQSAPLELIYRRERFVYPTDNRRNPFVSLLSLDDAGPQFEDLDLLGVIFGASQGSVATLIDRATERRYRIRRGDSVGNASVVEIRPDAVVFRVTQFGVTRSETLGIRKEEEEQG